MTTTHVETKKVGLDWYLKWVSTILILTSVAFRSAGPEYREWDIAIGFIATLGWTTVSIMWKDRALILLNGVMGCLLGSSLIQIWF